MANSWLEHVVRGTSLGGKTVEGGTRDVAPRRGIHWAGSSGHCSVQDGCRCRWIASGGDESGWDSTAHGWAPRGVKLWGDDLTLS